MGEARRSASAGGARPTGGHIRNTTLQVAQSLVFPPPFTMLDVYKHRLTRHLPFPPLASFVFGFQERERWKPFLGVCAVRLLGSVMPTWVGP